MSAHPPHLSAASPLTAKRSRPLKGRLRPPGDKSISHRAFLLGLLACGETKVEGLLEGDDVLRTGKACQALGAVVERLAPGQWSIRGPGLGALPPPRETLDFGNAGTGCRLMMGVVGGHGDHRHLRRRRILAQAADAAHPRSLEAHGRRGPVRG